MKHITQIMGQKSVILPQLQAQIRDFFILEAILDAILNYTKFSGMPDRNPEDSYRAHSQLSNEPMNRTIDNI